MNNITASQMIELILELEKESIKTRRDIVNASKYGKNKVDADVVDKILAALEGGEEDEV